MAYIITKFWFYPIMWALTGKIKGAENIPLGGSFIIVANHEKRLDPLLIIYAVLRKLNKKTHFLSAPTYFFVGNLIFRRWAGCIPLDNPKQAYEDLRKYAAEGKIIGIFPEGHLKASDRNPKSGAARLAAEMNIPILPIGIVPSYSPKGSRINIGKPVYLKKSKSPKKQIIKVMQKVYRLRSEIST